MNTALVVMFVGAGIFAVVDWWAVSRDNRPVEYVAKPATLALLVVAAVVADPIDPTARAWFVAALVLSLAGDVFLMLPSEKFLQGLVSFLAGHIAFVVGLSYLGWSPVGFGIAVGLVVAALVLVGTRVVREVRAGDESDFAVPVAVYMLVISAMVIAAGASGVAIALVGALLFYVSDSLIAWTKFIEPKPWGRVAIMVTYHLAQFSLVASLV